MTALPSKLAFLDVETTGLSPQRDRIIEVGVLRVEDGKVTSEFKSLINPNCYLPDEITVLTGINGADLENAPSFREIKDDLAEILDDCVMVAHNARFDYSFLKNEFRLVNSDFSPKQICTAKLSRSLFPQYMHHNLDSVIERYQLSCVQRHRAFDDAFVLWQFYQHLIKDFSEEVLLEAIKKTLKRPTVPLNIPLENLDKLPEEPGVYIFYGPGGMPLYVGKSINIRQRVLSHFSSDYLSSTEMKIAQQVENIDTVVTTGELSALIKESAMVKELKPLYNRKLRHLQKLTAMHKVLDENGYFRIVLSDLDQIDLENLENLVCVERSKKRCKEILIRLTKDFELCEKLLALEKTRDACFGYRLGRCKGACLKKEEPDDYNHRVEEALDAIQIEKWPFEQPILVSEQNIDGEGEAYIFDRWCYLGRFVFNQYEVTNFMENDIYFDLDIYKILKQFIHAPKNRRKIKIVSKDTLQQNYLSV